MGLTSFTIAECFKNTVLDELTHKYGYITPFKTIQCHRLRYNQSNESPHATCYNEVPIIVNNTNLHPISHGFLLSQSIGQSLSTWVSVFKSLVVDESLVPTTKFDIKNLYISRYRMMRKIFQS